MFYFLKRLAIKFKMFLPIGVGIFLAVLFITLLSIQFIRENIYEQLGQNISLEVHTISKMFEREKVLKLEQVKTNLNVIEENFKKADFSISNKKLQINAINQITNNTVKVKLNNWQIDGKDLLNNYEFVDNIQKLTGSTATIFQKIDSGYIRISTNVLDNNGNRAIKTFIPNNSPVVETIEKGKEFIGRAFVVNSWQITAYKPIYYKEKIIGMLYVGKNEKDLKELKKILTSFRINKSGYITVCDNEGNPVIFNKNENEIHKEIELVTKEKTKSKGIIRYYSETEKSDKMIAYQYIPDFELTVFAAVNLKKESEEIIDKIIFTSIIVGIIMLILLSVFVYFVTTKNLHTYLKQLEISNLKLAKAKEELEKTEKRFQILFNSGSDEVYVSNLYGEIIEVNTYACETLGYTREELLKMRWQDLKTSKFKQVVQQRIESIVKNGTLTYETEHITKQGKIILIEMKSRLIEYNQEQVILSIARNITERKAQEKQIINTIIETEEKERRRFAADLHDGLSPILTTIKLYADLLKAEKFNKTPKEEILQNIDELVSLALKSAKEISYNITPAILQDFGLSTAISEFTDYIKTTNSVEVDFSSSYNIKAPGIIEPVLYQVVKELINNTLKHANAKKIQLELKCENNQIILYYKDNGKGFNFKENLKSGNGLGLNNIVSKIKTIKGTCEFHSEKEKGMFVLIVLKIDENL